MSKLRSVLILLLPLIPISLLPIIAVAQISLDPAKAAIDSVKSEILEFCASEELRPHFSKTPCNPEDTTLEQMADKSRITNAEKVALSKARTENKRFVKETEDIFRQYYPQLAPSIIARRVHANIELDKITVAFYEGRITRGEYNKRRMEISHELIDLAAPTKPISSPPITTALVPKGVSEGNISADPGRAQTSNNNAEGIPLLMQGGTFVIPVQINGQITLNFTIDSGAADVSIPADVVSTLIRTGTIQKSDFVGQKTYRLADGSTVPSATFLIRSLKVGDRLLENVTGSIASAEADLLLGQSFLRRFKSWSIDNARQVLVLTQ